MSDREIKKVPALRGRMVLNLFYEASTRTRSSFELAAKRLSADVVNFAASGSSVEKGESLKDTVLTLSAHKPDAIVLRTPWAGASELVSRWCGAAIVNAGDGKHEHPTQALLDVYTLRRRLGSIDGASIWIVGDVAHSRVARSNVLAFQRMGAKVTIAGPPTLIPRGIEQLGCEVRYTLDELPSADVVYALRMQRERMSETWVPSLREYASWYQINAQAADAAPDPDAPRAGQPRRGALRRGGRLAAGGDHRPGRGRRGRAHGGALRAARGAARVPRRGAAPGRGDGGAHGRRWRALRERSRRRSSRAAAEPARLLLRDVRVLDPRAGIDARLDVRVRDGEIAELADAGTLEADAGEELIDGDGRLHAAAGVLRPARAPAHARPGAQGGSRQRHARGRRGRLRRRDRDAEHRPGARLGAAAALAARRGGARGARAGRLPAGDHARRSRASS